MEVQPLLAETLLLTLPELPQQELHQLELSQQVLSQLELNQLELNQSVKMPLTKLQPLELVLQMTELLKLSKHKSKVDFFVSFT
jgi:hypothetical protein